MKETAAIQIGRDDCKAFIHKCPFPEASQDAKEWELGFELEREMRNPKSFRSSFQKVQSIMDGTA